MYIVTHRLKPVLDQELTLYEQQHAVRLPRAYREWLKAYGEGTYAGWMNVQLPDAEVLKPFAEYDFWLHDADAPISEQQIAECISIGSSVDGDILAVHPEVEGLLWLPRHDEHIRLFPCLSSAFGATLDLIYREWYSSESPPGLLYYEPRKEERQHVFYLSKGAEHGLSMQQLAQKLKQELSWDAMLENEHTCILFKSAIGGYIRFNYAYNTEVAIFYEVATEAEQSLVLEIQQLLLEHHCLRMQPTGAEE
ncbi:hypothetical protein [Paenibacillus sp. SYP-B4298]|uniref:hypothetical protein n=1 Tax=Paenibacillus sp. SYP-B4298 TaxID=2996034 RepID=UPI0022DCEDAA|nr:hypothetical protein [Paenibacillus sp. SYP-B4298]